MQGKIDWQALPLIFELLGIEDAEMVIKQLMLIRDFQDGR